MVISTDLVELVSISDLHRKKKMSDGEKSIVNMKFSLIKRKELHFRCCRVNDIMCIIALFGIILMIIDTELRLNQFSKISEGIIRPLITISTLILISLIIYYHILDIRLYAINNQIVDWRITLTVRGFLMMICEVIVCSIHPFPYIKQTSLFGNIIWLEMILTLPSKLFFYS